MSTLINAVFLFAFGLLHYQANCQEMTILQSIAKLLSDRRSHSLWTPSIAYEEYPKNEYQQRQFDKDQKYETQVELILADLLVQLLGTAAAQELFKRASVYGLPSFDSLIFFDNYIISYDRRLKQPTWSMEYYHGRQMVKYGRLFRPGHYYFPDLSVHRYFRSSDFDYENSNYFRGHFTAAFDVPTNLRIMQQSFLYSNVAPMRYNIYRVDSLWYRLETYCNFIARRSKHTYIVTGAVYLPARSRMSYAIIGKSRIAVPSHFYKVILHETKAGIVLMEVFLVPNGDGPDDQSRLEQFRLNVAVDLPHLEKLTGLRFYDLLDRANMLKPTCFQHGYEDRLPK